MIEQALLEHLRAQPVLTDHLATYGGFPAVFSQEAPADTDGYWEDGPQYGRIVFSVDIQGDPERTMGGLLAVDIMCQKDANQYPEDIEPIIRSLIHGYFFSNGTFTVSAQFKNSAYFTEPKDQVTGCTVSFDLLAFPIITTSPVDAVARLNEWSATIPHVHVINHSPLPAPAWKPTGGESAVYWRRMTVSPAGWIPDTFQTIWRTATIRGHIFSETLAEASDLAEAITIGLYAIKRLRKEGESQVMVNRRNTTDNGADPLRMGQVTVEATYGVIVHHENGATLRNINLPENQALKGDSHG